MAAPRRGPAEAPHPAQVDHDQHVGGFQDGKALGVDELEQVGVQPPGHPGEEGGDEKGVEFEAPGITEVRLVATSSSRMAVIPRPKLE